MTAEATSSPPQAPWRLSAAAIAAQVAAGELSALEVCESCLVRVAEVEPGLGAFLEVLTDDARTQAAELDRRLAAGAAPGPLAGVPVAVKDNLAVAGHRLTCGSRILGDFVSPRDAAAVSRLRAAGAVVIGKTNLDEFAMGSSCERSAFHPTRNPWSPDRVPGGSSGGSAAAVASAVPLGLGSDTGGSIRQPAALCGVVGLRPTYGRVSRRGLVAFASSLDQVGPLCRDVRDAALVLGALAGPDPEDSTCSPAAPPDYLSGLEEGARGLRVGVLREIDDGALGADVRAVWRRGLRRLESLGARLRPVSVPNLPAAVPCYHVISNCEASANLARFDGVRYGRRVTDADGSGDLFRRSRSEGFGDEVKRRVLMGTFALSAGYHRAYYGRAQGVREAMQRQFASVFDQVDVVVCPTTATAAFRLGDRVEDPISMYLSDRFTAPASLAGLPALAVPSGLDNDGLPLSLQILGRPFDEATVLRVGRAFEQATGFDLMPLRTSAGAGSAAEAPRG